MTDPNRSAPNIGHGARGVSAHTLLKRVLLIAYHFPPDAAVGALRPLKFTKYLPHFGWEPYVLTVKPRYYSDLDHSRLDEVPCPESVFRTRMLPHPNTLYNDLKASYCRVTGHSQDLSHTLTESTSEHHPPHHALEGTRRFLSSLLCIPPDEVLGWLPIAAVKGMRLVKEHRIDYIYTTSPPHTPHLIGWFLKAACEVTWIADFRDLWLYPKPFHTRTVDRVDRWLERNVVANADAIALTTDRMTEKFRLTYPSLNSDKFTTISNGYDAEDFRSIAPRATETRFTLTYIGSFYDERTPEPLLVAVSKLIVEGKIPTRTLDIQLIGNCKYVKGRLTADIAASLGLSSIVKVIDPMPYKRALEYAMGSHLLLLLAPDQPYEVPGKAYEYLASGVDILALTQEGATADLIRKAGGGVVVDPQDIGGIQQAVLDRYRKWTADLPCARIEPPESMRMYERRELTRRLVSILESST